MSLHKLGRADEASDAFERLEEFTQGSSGASVEASVFFQEAKHLLKDGSDLPPDFVDPALLVRPGTGRGHGVTETFTSPRPRDP
jgi:hypothetical protein